MFLFASFIHTTANNDRPNIIFILTDDHRWDLTGYNGNSIIETAHLDRLATEGTRFNNAYVTSAICTPSRASYFLGQFERRHGVNFNSGTAVSAEAWQQSYPVILGKNGYYTGYIGKNHVPVGEKGYETGIMESAFDFWYGRHNHLRFYMKENKGGEIFKQAKADTQIEILQEGAMSFLDSEQDYIDGSVAFLGNRPTGQPFCLTIAFNLPHGAGTRDMKQRESDPELYRSKYRDQTIPLPVNYIARDDIQTPKIPGGVLRPEFRQTTYDNVNTPEANREAIIRQMQTVTGIDRFLGSMREKLDEMGIADNTIIIFASDHGIMLGEYGLGGKALNYEICLKIPFIIYDPSAKPSQSDELVMSVDVAPTLFDYADISIPSSIQGRSLKPLICNQTIDWREYTFAENLWSTTFGNPRIESVRDERWKYIRYFSTPRSLFEDNGGNQAYRVFPEAVEAYHDWLNQGYSNQEPDYEELFDLQNDPGEMTNLINDSKYKNTLNRLRSKCAELAREYRGDPNQPPATDRLELAKTGG